MLRSKFGGLNALAVAVSLALSFPAVAADFAAPPPPDESLAAPKGEKKASPSEEELLFGAPRVKVKIKATGDEAELDKAEVDLVIRKREAILKKLFELETMQDLRGKASEVYRSDSAKAEIERATPMTPEEIRVLRERLYNTEAASNAPLMSPSLKIRTAVVNIEENAPVDVNVVDSYTSSVVFFDQTGAPWPIEGKVLGNDQAFDSTVTGEGKNVVVFSIKKPFAESNALVFLKGVHMPVVLRLKGGASVVDSRFSVMVPKSGPEAKAQPFVGKKMQETSAELLAFLNGDRVEGAVKYQLQGVTGEVFEYGGALYVKSRASLMSPAWLDSLSSPAGFNVYKLQPVTTLRFSVDGKMVPAKVERYYAPEIMHDKSIFESASN